MKRRLTLGLVLALGLVLIASSVFAEDFKGRSLARMRAPSGEVRRTKRESREDGGIGVDGACDPRQAGVFGVAVLIHRAAVRP